LAIYSRVSPQITAEERLRKFEKAMGADDFGGKTPEETLKMFVAALRAGDVEQASRLFLLDENLSRDKWATALSKLKNEDRISDLINDLASVKPAPSEKTHEGDAKFYIYKDSNVDGLVNLELNKLSDVWKLESF